MQDLIGREIQQIQKKEFTSMRPGLSRIERFLGDVGNPEKDLKIVHIAGTNGKGSTAKVLSSILTANAKKTGLYISPHLTNITERISIDGKCISQREFNAYYKRFKNKAEKLGLTFFEIITAIAFEYFSKKKVDIAVLETGLGGRFDATNIINRPLLSIITEISLDHENILGGNIFKIAREKAGIIKKKCPVICGASNKEAILCIEKKAKKQRSDLYLLGRDFFCSKARIDWNKKGVGFNYKGRKLSSEIFVSLIGEHQARNCAVALFALEILAENKIVKIDLEKTVRVIGNICWKGRFEVRKIKTGSRQKNVIVDGAHNPSGVDSFLRTYSLSPWRRKRAAVIFAVMKDKKYREMINKLSSISGKVALLTAVNERALPVSKLQEIWSKYLPPKSIFACGSVGDAFKTFKNENLVIVVGSLFLAGRFLKEANELTREN